MISIKIDAEKGIGPDLRKRYKIAGFPTVIFVDNTGLEIDRILGYRPPDIFLSEMKRIQHREGTIEDLVRQYEAAPDVDSIIVKIAEKYEERLDQGSALEYWQKIFDRNSEYYDLAVFRKASNISMLQDSDVYLRNYITENPASPYVAEAYSNLRYYYRSAKDTTTEVALFEEILAYLDKNDAMTPSDLNSYAWRMTQLERNLDDALVKIRQAVQMMDNEPADERAGIMDTEAEILWKQGRVEEAIQIIDKCIELQPEDQYFKDQKAKFQQSV